MGGGVVRGVQTLLVFGFLVTLVLAWYHGEQGRQRASGPELLMIAALVGIAGIALMFVGRDGGEAVVGDAGNAGQVPSCV